MAEPVEELIERGAPGEHKDGEMRLLAVLFQKVAIKSVCRISVSKST